MMRDARSSLGIWLRKHLNVVEITASGVLTFVGDAGSEKAKD